MNILGLCYPIHPGHARSCNLGSHGAGDQVRGRVVLAPGVRPYQVVRRLQDVLPLRRSSG